MGLDQYIYRKTDKVCDNCNNTRTGANGRWCMECDPSGEEVAYFRKVNFLHRWVEEHLNEGRQTNCEEIPFHLEAMAGLMATCAQVLDKPELGPELLPTMGRFFFGSEAYDEYYLKDVEAVRDALWNILNTELARHPATPHQYVYISSW